SYTDPPRSRAIATGRNTCSDCMKNLWLLWLPRVLRRQNVSARVRRRQTGGPRNGRGSFSIPRGTLRLGAGKARTRAAISSRESVQPGPPAFSRACRQNPASHWRSYTALYFSVVPTALPVSVSILPSAEPVYVLW